jgi:hypothetical protein
MPVRESYRAGHLVHAYSPLWSRIGSDDDVLVVVDDVIGAIISGTKQY